MALARYWGAVMAMLSDEPSANLNPRTDSEIAALFQDWLRLEAELGASVTALGDAERDARERGDDDCPRVAELERRQKQICIEQRRLFQRMALTPAQGLPGIAFKLIQWRHDAAISAHKGLEQAYDACAFSAYLDLLRMLGLEAFAHPKDASTLRFIQSPEGLTAESWLTWNWESGGE